MIWLVNIPYIIIIFSWGSFLEDSSKINNSDDNSRTLVFGPNDYFYTDDSLEQISVNDTD